MGGVCRSPSPPPCWPNKGRPGKKPRVAPAHSLDAHARGPKRRRRGLHPEPAHFIQHHDNVAGSHEHLLFDFFAGKGLDAEGRVLQPPVAARGINSDLLFDRLLRVKLQDDDPLARLIDSDRGGDGQEFLFLDGDSHFAEWAGPHGDTVLISLQRDPVQKDLRAWHRTRFRMHLDPDRRPRLLADRRHGGSKQEEKRPGPA